MALRLYVLQGCPFGHRAAIALAEKQLPFERVAFERGKRPPELEAVSPRAKSPTLFDGQARVYESLAVLEYLEDKYPQLPLMPPTAEGRAEARMFIARVTEELAPRVGAVVAESTSPNQDGKKLAAALQQLMDNLPTWDRQLAMRTFAVAEALSLADIALYPFFPVLRRAAGVKIGGDLPHLRAWLERMQARPSTAL
jgi:glutathione S-transferase